MDTNYANTRPQEVAPAPVGVTAPPAPQVATAVATTPRDRIRWGPIWAGLFTALSSFLLLEMLFYGLGWLTLDVNPGAGTTASGSAPWLTAILAIVAFFAGGWIAQLTSSVRGTGEGLLNGFMVWALGTVLILAFSSLGLGIAFGSVGSVLSRMLLLGQAGTANLPNVTPAQIAGVARDTSIWAFVFLVVTAAAAAIGGWVGDQTRPVGQPTNYPQNVH